MSDCKNRIGTAISLMAAIESAHDKEVESLQQQVSDLKGERDGLRILVKEACGNCQCSPRERYSGHLIDCDVPHIEQQLEALANEQPKGDV